MFRDSPPVTDGLDAILGQLPAGWRCVDFGEERLVIGPTGAFVIGLSGRDVTPVAERVARRAADCRQALSRHFPSTPFVEALVVADRRSAPATAATVVRPHLLRETLLSGPVLLS